MTMIEKTKGNNKKFWQAINKIVGKHKNNAVKVLINSDNNGSITNDKKVIAEIFNKKFNEIGNTHTSLDNKINNYSISQQFYNRGINLKFEFKEVTNNHIVSIINTLKNKISGNNDIRIREIELIIDIILKPLTNEINKSISNGIYPTSLKQIKIIPVYKSGSKFLPENYRPISMTTNFAKIVDTVAYNQLNDYINSNDLISDNQFGFKRNHSCILQVIKLKDKLIDNLEKNNISIAIFIDIKQAFPSLNHDIMMQKLKSLGCERIVIKWFKDYLTKMEHYVYK